MLKSLVTTGQKERREVRTREKAQSMSQTIAAVAVSEQMSEPSTPSETRPAAADANREDEKAARRAALQAKQRARRAALEGRGTSNGESQPDLNDT